MAVEDGGLRLELYDADGLVHLRREQQRLLVHAALFLQLLGDELLAGVVAVDLECEGGQRHEVDAVALLEGGQVGVAQAQAQHVADAGVVAGRGTHPEHVVVAPLYVPRVVLPQRVEYDVCAGAAVVDVAEYVQLVDGQTLYDVADGHYEVVGTAGGDDGVHDDGHVGCLVLVVGAFVQQLLYDVRELGWQRLAHLRAGVFRRHVAAYAHQLVDGDVVPVVDVLFLGLDELQFLFGVVDERAQLFFLAFADGGAEYFRHLALDVARGVLQHVDEGLVLTVQVGKKMFGALGKVQYRLKVDYLACRLGHGGVGGGQQVEVSFLGRCH